MKSAMLSEDEMVKVICKEEIIGVLRMEDFDDKDSIETEEYIFSY